MILLLIEELPTLQKLKKQKPHVYLDDWNCCHCDVDNETFMHIWLCPKARSALTDIKDLAFTKLLSLLNNHLLPDINLANQLEHFSFWLIPNTTTFPSSSNLWFTDLIKGVIPHSLSSWLFNLGLSQNSIQSILSEWLFEIRTLAWQAIWLPRCDEFQLFLRRKGVTPAQQKSPKPPNMVSLTLSGPSRSQQSHDCLSLDFQSKVHDYFNIGAKFPFRLGNNRLVSVR